MERILEIEEVENFTDDCNQYPRYDGYLIKTDKQEIQILIDNHSQCCEEFGYFSSEDDFSDFLGAELFDIIEVDKEYKTKRLDLSYYNNSSVVFVNFETSAGTLQFTVYNAHNGYYGHEVIIKSNQYSYSEVL